MSDRSREELERNADSTGWVNGYGYLKSNASRTLGEKEGETCGGCGAKPWETCRCM